MAGDGVRRRAWVGAGCNIGPVQPPSYAETNHNHDWSEQTEPTMAANLIAITTALA